jgi:hypothetical protein
VNKVYSLRKYIIEYINREDIDFLKELIKRYHPMSLPSESGWALKHRWFAYIIDGYICGVAWLHDSTPFEGVARLFNIDPHKSYFLRRICETCPGIDIVEFLEMIASKLKEEDIEYIWTFKPKYEKGISVFKGSGFVEIGKTKTKREVIIKKLK